MNKNWECEWDIFGDFQTLWFRWQVPAVAGGSVVVQTEVTYAPSPRRIGKKKVKLNPVIRKIGGGGGSNCSQETNSPSQNYDKQPHALPVLLPNESEKKNVVVIGGKRKLKGKETKERQLAFTQCLKVIQVQNMQVEYFGRKNSNMFFWSKSKYLAFFNFGAKNSNELFSSILEHCVILWKTQNSTE